LSELETKGYKREEIAIGFIDESSPQSTANTVRVWSFDKPHIKNTTRMKANAMGFYPIVGEGVISFPENTKIESFNEFLRAIRAVNNDYKAIIVVLDNFSTHVSNRVKKECEQLGMYLAYLSPYSPDLNPIEFIWKSIKKLISIVFVENVNLQRAYHLLSRGSKSLSHRGFSFVGDYNRAIIQPSSLIAGIQSSYTLPLTSRNEVQFMVP